jgi:hypothetical protein
MFIQETAMLHEYQQAVREFYNIEATCVYHWNTEGTRVSPLNDLYTGRRKALVFKVFQFVDQDSTAIRECNAGV